MVDVTFVDLFEMPLGQTVATTTLSASTIATATTFNTAAPIPIGTTVELGTGTANVERRVTTNISGSGPFTHTVVALTNAHSSGDTVTTVGRSLITGTGKVGATTGVGNADLYISADGTHPTNAGHLAIASALANLICRLVKHTAY